MYEKKNKFEQNDCRNVLYIERTSSKSSKSPLKFSTHGRSKTDCTLTSWEFLLESLLLLMGVEDEFAKLPLVKRMLSSILSTVAFSFLFFFFVPLSSFILLLVRLLPNKFVCKELWYCVTFWRDKNMSFAFFTADSRMLLNSMILV